MPTRSRPSSGAGSPSATTSSSEASRRLVRGVNENGVTPTLVIEFVVNLYVLPFLVEAVLLLIVLVSTGMQAVLNSDPSAADPPTREFIDGVLTVVGLFYLGFSLVLVFTDLAGFFTSEHAEEFFVGPALTLTLIPFLYAVAWLSRREQEHLRSKWLSPASRRSRASGRVTLLRQRRGMPS